MVHARITDFGDSPMCTHNSPEISAFGKPDIEGDIAK